MFRQALLDHPVGAGDRIGADALPDAPKGGLIRSIGGWVFHPFLFAAYPILALFAQNAREVRTGELATLLLFAMAGVAGTWLIFAPLLRIARKAGLVASLVVLLFFTFSQVQEPANRIAAYLTWIWVPTTVEGLDTVWIVITEVLLLGAFAAVVGIRSKDPGRLTDLPECLRDRAGRDARRPDLHGQGARSRPVAGTPAGAPRHGVAAGGAGPSRHLLHHPRRLCP